jgi:cell division GTPase FtsZ
VEIHINQLQSFMAENIISTHNRVRRVKKMKLMIIGLGQCGNRIADEFAHLGDRAKRERGAKVITDAYAIDTDAPAMKGLQFIKSNKDHRIVIGEAKTKSHGTGGLAELGAQIFKEDGYKIVDVLRKTKRFPETDAFLLVAGAAGGTGSGGIPVLAKIMKEHYVEKPVYSVIVLPFEHEEAIDEKIILNTAVCLKSIHSVSDAVFLIDDQRYAAKGYSLASNIAKTNRLIAEPFFSLLCAGEETKRKRIGVHVLDAGGILQSLSGWTVLGYGRVNLRLITLPWDEIENKGNQVMEIALSELSLSCDAKSATKALYMVSAPAEEMNIDLVKYLGERIRGLAPDASIRYGDYPFNKGLIDLTLIFSGLKDVEKVTNYYTKSVSVAESMKMKQDVAESMPSATEEAAKDVPPLGK